MDKTVTTRYDIADHLRTPEEMAAYFEACREEADGDAAFMAKALGDMARAKGLSQVACDAGPGQVLVTGLGIEQQENKALAQVGCTQAASKSIAH